MFIALYIKEWREKSLLFVFELGVLALLLGAQFAVPKKDLREWLVYAVLLLFFPVASVLLGASGFEAEYRQGAWAYLFSRPVSRTSIWLAKLGAVVSMFTVLWLVFAASWAAWPAVREMAAGPRLFLKYIAETGFPWWGVCLSLFLLVVAFSLSQLHDRQVQIMFLSLVLGLLLVGAAWSLLVTENGLFLAFATPVKAVRTFLICLALMTAAFCGASLLTLLRSDFSQPRARLAGFGRWFVLLFTAALVLTIATALWVPVPSEEFLYFMGVSGDKAFYSTDEGIFAYDPASGQVDWLVKERRTHFLRSWAAGGRLAYLSYTYLGHRDAVMEIWVVNADGTGRKCVLGRNSPKPWPADPDILDLIMSPDGGMIAAITRSVSPGRPRRMDLEVWRVGADGSGLEKTHTDSVEWKGGYSYPTHDFVAWYPGRNAVVVRSPRKKASSKLAAQSLWLYDLDDGTATLLRDDAVPASWRTAGGPGGNYLTIKYPANANENPAKLALLDLSTRAETEIAAGELFLMFGTKWDPTGDRLLLCLRRAGQGGQQEYVLAIYSLSTRKIVAQRILARSERAAELARTAWMPDGRGLVSFDSEGRILSFLGPDLQETGLIDLPARLKFAWGLSIVGNQILIQDGHSLWRLDLATKRWKRIY